MIKILLIIFLFFFVFIRLGGFIMKLLFSGFVKKQQQQTSSQGYRQQRKPADGNVNVDYIPKNAKKGNTSKSDFKGGDFVDYEEVK